jgi:hypothetical protein
MMTSSVMLVLPEIVVQNFLPKFDLNSNLSKPVLQDLAEKIRAQGHIL